MHAAEIRRRFLEFFQERSHQVVPSSPLVPAGDETLLFTNAGMVQFKGIFVGDEETDFPRAVTSQKCLRAGGKHNDLEQVGQTARHHTFFEMLGNFSFGDYFKREAIGFAWDFLTQDLGMDPDRLFATVHHTDDEAAALWPEVTGIPPERVFRLGDKDNFWQMADTGPCGPCSEIHFDLRPEEEWGTIPSTEEFEERGEAGEFLELWNLVFMQFDRDAEGTLHPLPAPSIDTGAGLERIAAVLQKADSNYHTDLFLPLLERVADVVGRPYEADSDEGVSYRVLADHARAVAFLLADGVYPSSEGRGYVLRRILRRAVRHAWLLGRREPTLFRVVEAVTRRMSEAFPELAEREESILDLTRAEEERFLSTIDGGMERFDELAPSGADSAGSVIPGEEVFRLYDTFGFPLDLTQLMAEERGYRVDEEGFQEALEEQRARSRADRAVAQGSESGSTELGPWTWVEGVEQEYVVYGDGSAATRIAGVSVGDSTVGLALEAHPFYLEGGGQVSDGGTVSGEGWSLYVNRVSRVQDRHVVFGAVKGDFPGEGALGEAVTASVDRAARHDTERNHTGTHLLHAALRDTLGDHVAQRGSLVAPGRLRFDFSHGGPLSPDEMTRIEEAVNEAIWADHPVEVSFRSHQEAVAAGAMALFGEKYGDEVRVVEVPGISMELCGGTHVRHTGEIGLFRILSESGVAAGVRRIEAATGPGAYRSMARFEERVQALADTLKVTPENLERGVQKIAEERDELEKLLRDLRSGGGGDGATIVTEDQVELGGRTATFRGVRLLARGADDARAWGDAFLAEADAGAAVVAAELPGGKHTLFAFVSDPLIEAGLRADVLVREAAAVFGGRGGGRPHMAQAGVPDPSRLEEAIEAGAAYVRSLGANG
ncbi:MAG: alanine--tRNA ligase [Gemmatimonadetes bacterium]|nr:alanine--tRNA ligase [Gemmatimonadota bacterium]